MERQVLATRAGCPERARRTASPPAAANCRRDAASRRRGGASRIDDQRNSFEYYIISTHGGDSWDVVCFSLGVEERTDGLVCILLNVMV